MSGFTEITVSNGDNEIMIQIDIESHEVLGIYGYANNNIEIQRKSWKKKTNPSFV